VRERERKWDKQITDDNRSRFCAENDKRGGGFVLRGETLVTGHVDIVKYILFGYQVPLFPTMVGDLNKSCS
jgi:hypothetical protein